MAAKGTAKGVGSGGAAGGRNNRQAVDLGRALIEAFLTNKRPINQVLIDLLSPDVWGEPPCEKRRNIATTFAQCTMSGVCGSRCRPATASCRRSSTRAVVTVAEAKEALGQSTAQWSVWSSAASRAEATFPIGVPTWWPSCAERSHTTRDHRGQICHWASQLGAPLTPEQQLQMWEWDKRWKEIERE